MSDPVSEAKAAMLRGELYIADDPELARDNAAAPRCSPLTTRPRATPRSRGAALAELLGSSASAWRSGRRSSWTTATRPRSGRRTFINFDAVILDVARVTIGADVQIGPNVQLLTPTHPLDPELRRAARGAASRSRSRTTSGWAAA